MSLLREVPERIEDRPIVALDVPSTGEARDLVGERIFRAATGG
jgi:hypothetical protein